MLDYLVGLSAFLFPTLLGAVPLAAWCLDLLPW